MKINMDICDGLKDAKSRVGGGVHGSLFEKIISQENIFAAWREFQTGKRWKKDVLEFSQRAEEHLLQLHHELSAGTYRHSQYTHFMVHDPKLRHIHKASVCDRVLHHAVHRVLYPFFDRSFILDSYSSRIGKGTHAAIGRFGKLAWRLSRNRTRTVWVLQCDIRKYFDSVDHGVLLGLLRRKIEKAQSDFFSCHPGLACPQGAARNPGSGVPVPRSGSRLVGRDDRHGDISGDNESCRRLLEIIIRSFEIVSGKGIPLGNLTSQLFANIYLDPLDQYVKRILQAPVYIRYADDMLLAHTDKSLLEQWLRDIGVFVQEELLLELHPRKTTFRKWHQGVDILGYVSFPSHRIVRTRTKRRLLQRFSPKNASSYFGVTRHARAHRLERVMRGILEA